MASDLVVYVVVHQPQRLKLPAQPIPKGAIPDDIERCVFDSELNRFYFEKVSKTCYHPATSLFLQMVESGFKMSIGFSASFIKQALAWGPDVLEGFKNLVKHPNVELVCVEPSHSFIFFFDVEKFIDRMKWWRGYLKEIFGFEPKVTDTTEMYISNDVYFALLQAGFEGALMDGREWVLEWRDPTHLYTYVGKKLKLLPRHYDLSDDVGYRFSNRRWEGWPLKAETYAHWLKEARGDFVLIGWDMETFGEHQREDSGIFWFMGSLPRELEWRNITCLTPSEAIAKYEDKTHDLPLPEFGCTWAGSGGMEFFLGNSAQLAIFRLMQHVYNKAKLTGHERLLDIAMWLTQSDNLHTIQWFGRTGEEAEVSAYFTPRRWWELGPDRIIWEQQQVYKNVIRAMDHYL
ncbi:MAG: glycoside hydrolase family 57 protein [Actinomycetota bacterium]|nr:glycoside hydrolase family 57 protein [Actinomycetota bacterium]